jgi:hypothetical protein
MLAATLARPASPIYDVRHVGLQRRRDAGIVRRLVCGCLFPADVGESRSVAMHHY